MDGAHNNTACPLPTYKRAYILEQRIMPNRSLPLLDALVMPVVDERRQANIRTTRHKQNTPDSHSILSHAVNAHLAPDVPT